MTSLEHGRILVTGASGFVGHHAVHDLAGRGLPVRAMIRRPLPAGRRLPEAAEVVWADLTDPVSLAAAFAGVTHVVHLAGAADVSDPGINRAWNVDGVRHLARAAERAGVERVLFFSTNCVTRPLGDAYAETKREGEEILAAADLEVVTFRPTMIYGRGSREFETFVRAVRWCPRVPIFGDGRQTIRPVALADVLALVPDALARGELAGRTYDIAGPADVAFDDFLAVVAAAIGKPGRRALHVPGALGLAAARAIGALMEHPPITVDQVMGFLQCTRADVEPLRRDLGFDPRPVERGVPEVLGPGRAPGHAPLAAGVPTP